MFTLTLVLMAALLVAVWVTHRRHTAAVVMEWFNFQFICCVLTGWPVHACWHRTAARAARRDFMLTFLTVLFVASPLWWRYQSRGLFLMSIVWLAAALYETHMAADSRVAYRNHAFVLLLLLGVSMVAFPFFYWLLPRAALITAWSWYAVAAGFIVWRTVVQPWAEMVQANAKWYHTQWPAE